MFGEEHHILKHAQLPKSKNLGNQKQQRNFAPANMLDKMEELQEYVDFSQGKKSKRL